MGLIQSFISQTWPPAPKFSVDQIPDLTGRVVFITGGNTGIGYEIAKALLSKNAKVYLGCRREERAQKAIARLREETGGKEAVFLKLDLASLQSIKDAANEFLRLEKELHVLFNNAGVMEPSIDELTKEGYDLTIGTNVLGHYYLTDLLLPALLAVSKGAGFQKQKKARVVTTSSFASEISPRKIDYSAFKDGPLRRKIGVEGLYYRSKWLNIVYATELSRRYGDKGIVSTSLNPGHIHTELQRTLTGLKRWAILKILQPTPMGALSQLYAATAEDADDFDGAYFIPWARRGTPNPTTQDPAEGKKLWEWLEAQVR
ncbi:NAD(P)-binding protein [Marasmius fiardii PR-910]|nr:NAD(P)-binding protein [Marasmius fiardii PR-910]